MVLRPEADRLIHSAVRQQPYAVFAFNQDDFQGGVISMYHIIGGPRDRSSVTAETLRALGIEVPA